MKSHQESPDGRDERARAAVSKSRSKSEKRLENRVSALLDENEDLRRQLSLQGQRIEVQNRQIEELKVLVSQLQAAQNRVSSPKRKKGRVSQEAATQEELDLGRSRVSRSPEPSQVISPQTAERPEMLSQESASYAKVAAAPKFSAKIPPIVVENPDDWAALRKEIKETKTDIVKAKILGKSVKIYVKDSSDFRRLTAFLESHNRAYYSYRLPEEKKIYAVVRGLPITAEIEDIRDELSSLGVTDSEVSRMTSFRTKEPMPLFLVKTKNQDVFKVTRMLDLVVRVEPKKKSAMPSQCYRCQQFGHTQLRCTFPQKCVKCAGSHSAGECTLASAEGERNARCANCKQVGHPASYRGCPNYSYKRKVPVAKSGQRAPISARPTEKVASQCTGLVTTIVSTIMPEIQKVILAALENYDKHV